jgi:transposase
MPYIKPLIDVNQVMITTFDELVAPDSTARIIRYFVENVDLGEMGFSNTNPALEGRPSYPPSNMVMLYLYGYRNNIRSSRKLQKACEVNIEVKWLMNGLTPDFRVISDFRKDNIGSLKKLYHEFTKRVMVDLETGDVSIDGSKFKAWNSKDRNFTVHKLEERMEWIEDHTAEYLRLIEIADANEDTIEGEFTREELEQKVNELQERLEKYKGYRELMISQGLSQLSLTDPDCRLMKNKNGMDTAYNVQTAVDTETHMLLDYHMTNANTDHGQLAPTMEHLKEQAPSDIMNVIADKGYHRDTDYVECLENGIIPNVIPDDGKDTYELEIDYVDSECDPASHEAEELKKCLHAGIIPETYKDSIEDIKVVEVRCKPEDAKKSSDPQESQRPVEDMKARAREGYFVRDPEADCVYCPGGATLYKKSIKKDGSTRYCNKKLCKQCPYRNKCVTSIKYPWKEVDFSKDCLEKKAKWWAGDDPDPDDGVKSGSTDKGEKTEKKKPGFHYEKRMKVRFKLRPNREKMDKRKCTSEHPFGTIKRWHNSGYFLLKGMRKVDGEFALFGIGYNLSRAENMYTFEELMEKVGRRVA